jgi:hypothetical protein
MLFELNYFPREIVIETISLGIIVMISHQNYLNKISNCGSDLSCFNVHAPTCPRDTIICLLDDKMASAEAGMNSDFN